MKSKSSCKETQQVGSPAIDEIEKAKKMKCSHKVFNEKESAISRKNAKIKTKWRKVRGMKENNESCFLSSDNSTGDDQAPVLDKFTIDEASTMEEVSEKNHHDNKG